MFYCTNTTGKICLSNAELALSESNDLLIVSSGRWGKEGRNGGECELYAKNQELKGNISVDSMSSLLMDLSSSTFSGASGLSGSAASRPQASSSTSQDIIKSSRPSWRTRASSQHSLPPSKNSERPE